MKGEGKRGLKREGELCLIIFFLEKGDYFRAGLNRGFMAGLEINARKLAKCE